MSQEQAYQLAVKVYLAGENGEPLPDVPDHCRKAAQDLWQRARRRAGIK